MNLLTDNDRYLFNEGSHFDLHHKLGAHPLRPGSEKGYRFAVWAPDADFVSVIGDFNGWSRDRNPLTPQGESGVWAGDVPEAHRGNAYKFFVRSRINGYAVEKADPFAFRSEAPPKTASVAWDLAYEWNDGRWMSERVSKNALGAPISIYEVHLGSWMRVPEDGNRSLTYREIAPKLAAYVKEMGFTHVEFMPIMEHPFYGSWGYQVTSYFAPSARFGTPQDFMYLIDHLHQNGIGVFLDWVPSHFPQDEHGLVYFDGTHLFEHSDPRKGFHPDWRSAIFNYGRNEVRCFLISSALFWLEFYHADGLRVDGVASMLYLDYSRQEGEWIPNKFGGRENLEAIDFLKRMNAEVFRRFPDVQTIAEESTAWPMVSRPTYVGGLGFGMKWDMGWMHDILSYMAKDPVYRKYHQGDLTFRMIYAFNENFVLSLSHDEVVHGKGSLLSKMSGWDGEKFANLRVLFGQMFGMPGKKLMFMGSEFGQGHEWNHDASLDWHLLEIPLHRGVQLWVRDLNRLYRTEPALYEHDFEPAGFQWIDGSDAQNSTLSFLRRGRSETILVVLNFTPIERRGYRVGVPEAGRWKELLNSDAQVYGGSGSGNQGGVSTTDVSSHGQPHSIELTLPPLGALFLKRSDV